MGKGLFLQEPAGAKLVATMNQIYLGGETSQIDGLLNGAVASADHGDFLVLIKGPVTGSAIGNPLTGQPFLPGDPQPFVHGPGGDNNGFGLDTFDSTP